MNDGRFFPYRTDPDALTLVLDAEGAETLRRGDRALIASNPSASSISISASVSVAETELPALLGDNEDLEQTIELLLLVKSATSRRRMSLPLSGHTGVYWTTFTIDRDGWTGTVTCQAVAVRRATATGPVEGRARERGAMVAWSPPVEIVLDEPASPGGLAIPVRWVSFGQSTDARLREYADQLFSISMESGGPVVLVNQDVEQARLVMDSEGRRGGRARIRDAASFLIAHQVWSSVLAMALTSAGDVRRRLADASPANPASSQDVLAELEDWERAVCEDWSTHLYPGTGDHEALELLVEAAGEPAGMRVLMTRLPDAIQQRFSTTGGFRGLVRELL